MPRFKRVMPRVPVAHLDRTIEFYAEMLGFNAAVLWPEEQPIFCILDRDDIRIGFYTPDEHRPTAPTGAAEFHIDVEDVRGLHGALQGRLPIEWGPEVFFYGRREFAVRDPDGYLLIFSEITDDPPTCPEE